MVFYVPTYLGLNVNNHLWYVPTYHWYRIVSFTLQARTQDDRTSRDFERAKICKYNTYDVWYHTYLLYII